MKKGDRIVKKICLKTIVIIMLTVLMLGISMLFVGCEDNENKCYEITIHPIHPITGEEVYPITLDSETLYGDREFIEIKFKEKGKNKFLPNKYISLNELNSLVDIYVSTLDSDYKETIMLHGSIKYPENIPKEKGTYRIQVEFNYYTYDAYGDVLILSTKFKQTYLNFGLKII